MPRPTRLSIAVSRDFWLPGVVCSYGYFLLAPNRWRPETLSLERRLDTAELGLGAGSVSLTVDQPGGRGDAVRVRCDRALTREASAAVRRALERMLRVGLDLSLWRRRHPVARRSGFGRLFRSPTLFEDMVKTITSCNVGWPSTVRMNQRLVDRVGDGAFPTSALLARWTPSRLQRSCKVGYRARRIIGLARRFDREELDPAWFESPDRETEAIREALLRLDGFGPYAAANVLQLLGRFDHLPIDTETYRLFCKTQRVARSEDPKRLDRLIESHYEPHRPYRFLAYWHDLWRDYESQRGPAWAWDADEVGSSFTASALD